MNRDILNLFSASVAAVHASDALATEVAQQASSQAREARGDVQALQMDIEKLFIITETLWGILKEKNGMTDEELIQRVQDTDMQDGRLDGKIAKLPPEPCPQCKRPISRNRTLCLYCGTPSTGYPFAR
jgi:hypothetical protein